MRRAISRQWNLNDLLKEAAQQEQTEVEIIEMRKETREVNKIQPKRGGRRGGGRLPSMHHTRTENNKQCSYCGLVNKHPPGRDCPAYGRTCAKCGKRGHYAAMCRNEPDERIQRGRNHRESKRGRRPRSRAPVRKTREENYEETEEENDDHSDVEFIRKAVSNLKKIRFVQEPLKTKKITEDEWKSAVCVQIGDVQAMVEPDTGACVNLIDEHQFKAIKKYSKENIILENQL